MGSKRLTGDAPPRQTLAAVQGKGGGLNSPPSLSQHTSPGLGQCHTPLCLSAQVGGRGGGLAGAPSQTRTGVSYSQEGGVLNPFPPLCLSLLAPSSVWACLCHFHLNGELGKARQRLFCPHQVDPSGGPMPVKEGSLKSLPPFVSFSILACAQPRPWLWFRSRFPIPNPFLATWSSDNALAQDQRAGAGADSTIQPRASKLPGILGDCDLT